MNENELESSNEATAWFCLQDYLPNWFSFIDFFQQDKMLFSTTPNVTYLIMLCNTKVVKQNVTLDYSFLNTFLLIASFRTTEMYINY